MMILLCTKQTKNSLWLFEEFFFFPWPRPGISLSLVLSHSGVVAFTLGGRFPLFLLHICERNHNSANYGGNWPRGRFLGMYSSQQEAGICAKSGF